MDSSVAGYCVGRTEGVTFVDGCFFQVWGEIPMRGVYYKSNL